MSQQKVSASTGVLQYPTYTRQSKRTFPALFNESTPAVYPAPLDDLLDGPKEMVDYAAIYLENEHLKLTIVPDLGGKIWSVYDKNAKDEILYVPDVIRPSLVAANGAWIPGGIEYNFPVGHFVDTMGPVPCAIVDQSPERASVLAEIYHPHTGLRLKILVVLRAGEACFDIEYLAWNPTTTPKRWGMWCNVGTYAHDDWQFFSKAKLYHTGFTLHDYPFDATGLDTSLWKNRAISSDSFMMGSLDNYFGYYDHRRKVGLAHVSTDKSMCGMKYHTWGRKYRNYWPEVCFTEDHRNYTEIQSGRHETQLDFSILQPGQSEAFKETWMPYRQTGGLEWMNRELLYHVRDGKLCVYSFRDAEVAISVDGVVEKRQIKAAQLEHFPQSVKDGSDLKVSVNGQEVFACQHPYPGKQEKGARERISEMHNGKPIQELKTAAEFLKAARRHFEWDRIKESIADYRTALKLDPKNHDAVFELAGCLWRVGDFDAGEKLLKSLMKTSLKDSVEVRLANRERAEQEFFGTVLTMPAGVDRDVAVCERYAGYNNPTAALPLLTKVLRTHPTHIRANLLMAVLLNKALKTPKKSLPYVKTVLKSKPVDRDIILELAGLFNAAGEFSETLKLLKAAPKAVRELSAAAKFQALALFETGEDLKCHELMSTTRLFNWEGELTHLDTYIDSTLALCEKALKRGEAKQALRYAQAVQKNPATLGMETKHMSHARRRYWLGKALFAAGRTTEAAAEFQAGFHVSIHERDLRLNGSYGKMWPRWATDEDAYMVLRCAEKVGTKEAREQSYEFVNSLMETRGLYGFGTDHSLLQAYVLEFEGKFGAAEKQLKACIAKRTETRMATMHYQAVLKKSRRGD